MGKCWICGAEGKSGEHLIKASDIRQRFGRVSQKEPLYLHTKERRNRPITGMKSRALKSSAPMCAKCNNEVSQPLDVAWQTLSAYLCARQPAVRSGDRIRLQKVFPGSVRRSMLNVHLFFVKALGCKIVEGEAPIPIEPFSRAILQRIPNPYVHIAFCPGVNVGRSLSNSEIHAEEDNAGVRIAVWHYSLDAVTVVVAFSRRSGMHPDYWYPATVGKHLRVVPLGQ